MDRYVSEGLNMEYATRDDAEPSGVALIMVHAQGQNIIAVSQGANARLRPVDVESAITAISESDCVMVQLEIPLETARRAIELGSQAGASVVLNPAPATQLPAGFLVGVDILTPNRTEAETLVGFEISAENDMILAAGQLASLGIGTVVMTLGAKGAFAYGGGQHTLLDGFRVPMLDSTAAGDAFSAALEVAVAEGLQLDASATYANAAAALSVTKSGAQPSLPLSEDVDRFLSKLQQSPLGGNSDSQTMNV
jgi:ribokinase